MTTLESSEVQQETTVDPSGNTEYLQTNEKAAIREKVESLDFQSVAYDLRSVFSKVNGWGVGKQVKQKVKLLQPLEPLLREMLYDDERVLFVTKGMFSSFIEQYFMGWIAYLINRTTFLFTNLRIIQFSTDRKSRPNHMKWQIPYDAMRKFKVGGLLGKSIRFKLHNGKKYVFASTPSYDVKALRALVTRQMEQVTSEAIGLPNHGGCDSLCTTCFAPLPSKTYACANCQETFIRPIKPTLMSLAFPCLGNFYLGHGGIAIYELIAYVVSWIFLISALTLGPEKIDVLSAAMFIAPILLIEHSLDALLTYRIASKGRIAEKDAWCKP